MNEYLSIITSNVNGFYAPIKRHRVAEWIRTHDPHIFCLQETHLRTKYLHKLKVKGWKKCSKQKDRRKKLGWQYSYQTKLTPNKGHKKKQERTLHNDQVKNLSRTHKHCKHICTQHRSTQIYKENLG